MSRHQEGRYSKIPGIVSAVTATIYFACILYMGYIWLGFDQEPEADRKQEIVMNLFAASFYIAHITAPVRLISDFFLVWQYRRQKKDTSFVITLDVIIIVIELMFLLFGLLFSGVPQF